MLVGQRNTLQHRQITIGFTQARHHAKHGMNSGRGMNRAAMMIGRQLC